MQNGVLILCRIFTVTLPACAGLKCLNSVGSDDRGRVIDLDDFFMAATLKMQLKDTV